MRQKVVSIFVKETRLEPNIAFELLDIFFLESDHELQYFVRLEIELDTQNKWLL